MFERTKLTSMKGFRDYKLPRIIPLSQRPAEKQYCMFCGISTMHGYIAGMSKKTCSRHYAGNADLEGINYSTTYTTTNLN